MATKTFTADKDKQVRRQTDLNPKQGCGNDQHMLAGPTGASGSSQMHYRSLVHFPVSYAGMSRVVKVEIVLTTETSSTHFTVGSKPHVRVESLKSAFASGNNAENVWDTNEYEWPGVLAGVESDCPINPATGLAQDEAPVFIDVTALAKTIAPTGVTFADGSKGGGKPNYGFLVRTNGKETDTAARMIFHSQHSSVAKPYMLVTYDVPNQAPTAPTLTDPPLTNVTFGQSFTGAHHDPDLDPMSARSIEVWAAGQTGVAGKKAVWTLPANLQSAGSDETLTSIFSVPLSLAAAVLKLGTAYEWRAQTADSHGLWGAFSAPRAMTITSSAPVVVASNIGSVAAMASQNFGGAYSDPGQATPDPLSLFQMQMQPQSAPADWSDPGQYVWDTGETQASAGEIATSTISRPYGGAPLGQGTYVYRIRVADSTGVWSVWSQDTFILTADYNIDPGAIDLTTQIARNAPVRIALYGMGVARGPGALIGYIDDPMNLGTSAYLSGAGELYFTLPALHPYCPSIEPHQTHYAVEQWYGDRYRVLFAGLITDFDADTDTAIFYGTDYLGLLQTAVDERYDPNNDRKAPPAGSYYSNMTVDAIIRDQLKYHQGVSDSPVGFITTGPLSTIAERATIYSTYAEALPFIGGLIDSHKQGTGREARFYARKVAAAGNTVLAAAVAAGAKNIKVASVANFAAGDAFTIADHEVLHISTVGTAGAGGTGITFSTALTWPYPAGTPVIEVAWEWALVDNWGKDRPNIQLEYGGIVNDFRVVALGDFATRVLGVGQKRGEVKVYRASGTGGLPEPTYGRTAKTAFFPDITDQNDLQRRVNENANQLAKVGKRLALAIQADVLSPFDGWDLGDNILINIQRGVVDTNRYGSADAAYPGAGGYWTIYGVEWRYEPDGHSDLTLTILPKKTATPPNPDLIPSINPGLPIDWQVGHGVPTSYGLPPSPTPPPASLLSIESQDDEVTAFDTLPLTTEPVQAQHYQDLNTGCVYEYDEPTDTYTSVYCPPAPDDGGGFVPDTTPPDVPVIKSTSSVSETQDDGTALTNLSAVIGYATPPVGLLDLDQIVMQSTRFGLPVDPTQPDWTLATQWLTQSSDKTGTADTNVIQPVVHSATGYWLQAAAVDASGNRSGWSPVIKVITASDEDGPPQPSDVTLDAGMNAFSVRWASIPVADLAYVEVQWRVHGTTDVWGSIENAGTMIVVTGVENETTYDVRVRSVDTSGNTLNDTGGGVFETVKADDEPEKGWVVAGQVTPTALPGNAFIWDEAIFNDVFAGNINADWITAGTLKVGSLANDQAAAIEVYNSAGVLIGRWSDQGIEVWDPANSDYKMVITAAGLVIYTNMNGALATPPTQPIPVVSMGPLGIDAASITFGSARGGHNLVLNSSFELGAFAVSSLVNNVWDLAADWNAGRQGADVNISVGASSLTMAVI